MSGKLHQYRSFFVILALVSLTWLVADLLSTRSYQTSVKVLFTGVDTARYVLVTDDHETVLNIESDGFTALFHHITRQHKSLEIDLSGILKMSGDGSPAKLTVATADYAEQMQHHIAPVGECTVSFVKESLYVTIYERESRGFVPQLRNVTFRFRDGFGLSGKPSITPDTVYLYGSRKSLDDIEALYTKAADIDVPDTGGRFELELEGVWEKHGDLRVSSRSVSIDIPTEAYVECQQTIKVDFEGSDSVHHVRLYPDQVTVTTWVPQSTYNQNSTFRMKAVAKQQDHIGHNGLLVTVSDFPSDMRIKSVEPDRVQYVIIK